MIGNISGIFDEDLNEFERRAVFIYIASISEMPRKELIKIIADSDLKNKDSIMSTLERIQEHGYKKGMKIGEEKGIEKEKREQFKKQIELIKTMHAESFQPEFIARILKIKLRLVEDVLSGKVKKFDDLKIYENEKK